MGRAVAAKLPTPFGVNGEFKDIDVVVLTDAEPNFLNKIMDEAKILARPLSLDEHFRGQIKLYGKGSGSLAAISYKNICLPISREVFNMETARLAGVEVPTFSAATLFYIWLISGYPRPKDWRQLKAYRRVIRDKSLATSDEIYKPFLTLYRAQKKLYPKDQFLGDLRWAYHTKIPEQIRRVFSSLTEPIWKTLSHK
ncbi:MAG: hypothetical protein ACOZAN_04510 [Patescibacteria group bacterium]